MMPRVCTELQPRADSNPSSTFHSFTLCWSLAAGTCSLLFAVVIVVSHRTSPPRQSGMTRSLKLDSHLHVLDRSGRLAKDLLQEYLSDSALYVVSKGASCMEPLVRIFRECCAYTYVERERRKDL